MGVINYCYRKISKWRKYFSMKMLCGKFSECGENLSIGRQFCYHELQNVSIGDNFSAGERLKLRTFSSWRNQKFSPKIVIGNNVSIQTDCHISAINSVEIGNDVLIASFVYISDHSHGYMDERDVLTPHYQRLTFKRIR